MQNKVWALPEVIDELENLIDILFEKEYFGFEEAAVNYVVELFEEIINYLPYRLRKPAPKFFTDRYGKGLLYSIFSKSKRTKWYVFFRIYRKDGDTYYQVRYIGNNYTCAQHFFS